VSIALRLIRSTNPGIAGSEMYDNGDMGSSGGSRQRLEALSLWIAWVSPPPARGRGLTFW